VKEVNHKFYKLLIIPLMLAVLVFSSIVSAQETITLEQALKWGIKNNAGLQEKIYDEKKALIDLESAKKAFYPEISFSTSYTRMFLDEGDSSGDSGNTVPVPESDFDSVLFNNMMEIMSAMQPSEDNYKTGISIQQPLYLGGKIWLGMEQAEIGLDMAELQVGQKENELLLDIIQSYYNVLLAQERVDIEKEALELVREHRRTAEVSYKAGITLKTDVLQVEIEEGKAVHSLEVARNDLLMAKKMLGNVIGFDLEDKEFIQPGFKPDLNLEKDKQYEIAKQNRIELELLSLNKEILETNLQMEKNSHLPNIILSGNYQWQGEEFSLNDGTGSITLSASVNIFDRGLSKNKEDKINEDIKKLDLNRSNLEELVEIEIEDLLLTIKENKNNIELQELNLKKAEENLELETKSYKVGMGTNVDVMNAQMVLKQTKIAGMQAEYQYKINLFKLLQKTGQLADYCEGVIINE